MQPWISCHPSFSHTHWQLHASQGHGVVIVVDDVVLDVVLGGAPVVLDVLDVVLDVVLGGAPVVLDVLDVVLDVVLGGAPVVLDVLDVVLDGAAVVVVVLVVLVLVVVLVLDVVDDVVLDVVVLVVVLVVVELVVVLVLDVVGPFSHIPERITRNRGSQGFPIISEVQIQPSPEQLDEPIPQIPREQSLFVHRHRISHVP